MSRKLLFLSAVAFATAFGCGSLSNRDPSIAKVSGTLAGAAPAGARVALVWHAPDKSWVVTNEAPIVNGSFSIDLTGAPPDSLFFVPNTNSNAPSATVDAPATGSSSGGSGSGSSSPPSAGGTSTSGGGAGLRPMDVVSGGVSGPLSAAVAAFVLYADGNGNGKLDITGDDAASPDTILGGSKELMLVYLRDGSDLDLEKLRDKVGQLPSRGYSLVLTSQSRWVPLSDVDLKLDEANKAFPYDVCKVQSLSAGDSSFTSGNDIAPTTANGGAAGGSSGSTSGGSSTGYSYSNGTVPPPSLDHGPYPAKGDPNVHCNPDGRGWQYYGCAAKPTGLCASWDAPQCTDYGAQLGSAQNAPDGWPCNAQPAPSGSTSSSSSGTSGSSGAFDAGSADSGS